MNKRGAEELLLQIGYLLLLAIILIAILYFINSSQQGKLAQMNTKVREAAVWIDTAMNSEDFASTQLKIPKDDFEIVFDEKVGEIKVFDKKVKPIERFQRVFINKNKEISQKDETNSLKIEIKDEQE